MNRGRGEIDPPSGQAAPSKPNRLRRSFRRTQQTQTAAELDPPQSQQPDLRTPTRIQRSRASDGFNGESPHNDSDFQQDIIWDATSPSPNRLGKRGKKQRAGAVDISEIVSRIAPKHGRPKVAEPTLQQWIGDSAAIPCTPDVQVPKPKKKSPRPGGVDDLLKLAKQFDFNMFCQDEEEQEEEEEVEKEGWQSPQLLSGDNDLSPPRNCGVQLMEDDLDFLFDGPTQHLGGNLSQVTSQAKGAPSREASGKPAASSHAPGRDEFEDDWDDDDLLNDSLVQAMTQNPQDFAAPTLCSTQKPASHMTRPTQSPGGSAVPSADKTRQRTTFRLESNPRFSVRRQDVRTDGRTERRDALQGVFPSGNGVFPSGNGVFPSGNGVLAEAGTPNTLRSPSLSHQRTPALKHNTAALKPAPVAPPALDPLDEDLTAFFASDPVWDDAADDDLMCELCDDVENQMKHVQSVSSTQALPVSQRTALQPANQQALPVSQRTALQPANQQALPVSQRAALQPANQQALPVSQRAALQPANQQALPVSQRAALQPANQQALPVSQRTALQPANQQALPVSQRAALQPANQQLPAGRRAGGALAAGFGFQVKTASDSSASSVRSGGSACVRSAPRGNDQFTFKRPDVPVCTSSRGTKAASTSAVKCSAAEIELKKQQAMERRRQRLQAAGSLTALT